MALKIAALEHVQITVPREREEEALHFYGTVMGLQEIPKPPRLARNGGAWYRLGAVELHVSLEDVTAAENTASRRHVCYVVGDLAKAEAHFRKHEVPVTADRQPIEGWVRFYVRDPGGNRIEIAQRKGR